MTRIKIRHFAFIEGQDARANGYTGPNPYGDPETSENAKQWRDGYLGGPFPISKEAQS